MNLKKLSTYLNEEKVSQEELAGLIGLANEHGVRFPDNYTSLVQRGAFVGLDREMYNEIKKWILDNSRR